jgi:hypothetical protein
MNNTIHTFAQAFIHSFDRIASRAQSHARQLAKHHARKLAQSHARQQFSAHVPQTRKGGKVSASALSYHVSQRGIKALLPVVALAMYAAPVSGQVPFNFTADRSGTTLSPIYGLASTDSNYLLSSSGFTKEKELNFSNFNETEQNTLPGFTHTEFPIIDAASFNNDYMFQLDSSGNIYKVNTTNGSFDTSFGTGGVVETGTSNTFGIGYDATTNRIGIGQMNGSEMKFGTYDVGTSTLSWNDGFSFDPIQYGTPTGLDFARVGNSDRMLVGTKDGPGAFSQPANFILDMDFNSGNVGQYATISGTDNKLQDLHYLDGKLALAFQDGTTGGIQVMDNFAPIPEPRSMALIAGLGALVFVFSRKRRRG